MNNYSSSSVVSINKRRSKFSLHQNIKTSLNVGDLVPFNVQEVLPGDSFKVDIQNLSRLSSEWIKAPMDNLFMDTYHFFVPNRLVFDKWKELQGENTSSSWTQPVDYVVPQLTFSGSAKPLKGTIANYFGIPQMTGLPSISALPFRAYALIWNEWFRDQNVQDPVHIKVGQETEVFNTNAFGPDNYTGMVAKINKQHDYFTSALPAPQKGDPVSVAVISGKIPVSTGDNRAPEDSKAPLQWAIAGSTAAQPDINKNGVVKFPTFPSATAFPGLNKNSLYLSERFASDPGFTAGVDQIYPTNLWGDLGKQAAITINDLRFAFALQKMLEKDARGGTRYTEIIQAHFGVQSPDSRLQRPEFLGGNRTPITIQQVVQNSASIKGSTNQGNISGMSLSGGYSGYRKGFVEHGLVISVMAIRQKHSYQQGINKFWFRKSRTDFYNPAFSNIGEQPIYQKEIFASSPNLNVFGYNEAWADLRYKPDMITGELSSLDPQTQDIWHFGDLYTNAPVISKEFVAETASYVDRTIRVPSKTAHQFIIDIYVKNEAVRVLPTYSTPGGV